MWEVVEGGAIATSVWERWKAGESRVRGQDTGGGRVNQIVQSFKLLEHSRIAEAVRRSGGGWRAKTTLVALGGIAESWSGVGEERGREVERGGSGARVVVRLTAAPPWRRRGGVAP